ncbi:Uncharacterised protein [Bordetella pertussis]|nr:Uncharacterised protein [Bordetella pertussis]CFO80416.1 Uncharacterised protein [Bordetella pertussis]CFU92326.1 Uncharacterised protein [Bordetella pertussis]CPI38983.1 Uncharacterised protein [Bordetella pertussis]CPL32332.1 Uncharacterised protein [Bordetella pertussis]
MPIQPLSACLMYVPFFFSMSEKVTFWNLSCSEYTATPVNV